MGRGRPKAPRFTATPSSFTHLWSPGSSDAQKLGFAYVYGTDGTLLGEYGMGGSNSSGTTQYLYLPTANGPMPIAAIVNGGAYAVHSDHLNTPRKLTQPDGQVAWQWAYSAFGDEQPTLGFKRFTDATTIPTTGTTTIPEVTFNLRYPGQYYDKESNLHYNYFRSYSAERGRYTQADPIGLDGGFNRFGYVGSNPMSNYDRFGLSENDVFIIRAIFELEINKLNTCKCRLPTTGKLGAIANNVYKFYSGNEKLLECYGQATDLLGELAKNSKSLDDKWRLEMMTRPGHYWLEGRSNNPKDPLLILDPWVNSFDVRPAGDASLGAPAGAIPGAECFCEK